MACLGSGLMSIKNRLVCSRNILRPITAAAAAAALVLDERVFHNHLSTLRATGTVSPDSRYCSERHQNAIA